jgi:hypothetical protein
MTQVRDPRFDEHWRAFDDVIEFARQLVADDADIDVDYLDDGLIGVAQMTPSNPRARAVNLIAAQWLIVTIGDHGGRWELDYTDKDLTLAKDLVAAAIAGRLEECFAFGRSRVAVTFANGTTAAETGYFGCVSLLVPLPGWTRWGRRVRYEPYRQS